MPNTHPLVIVLGAGASKEVKFPTGAELTKSIAESLDFKVTHFGHLEGGDDRIRECIYKLGQSANNSHGTPDDYYRAALTIRDAMPLAPSIDNFIDSHRNDKKIAQLGKLAIAACILKAEKDSTLFVDRSNSNNKLDFTKLNGTWFTTLFSLVTQHCANEELEDRFSQLTIVSFNYDRCFKQFLRQALPTYYSISQSDADRIVSKVAILYPYGSIGKMRFETQGQGTDFGEHPMSDDLLVSANGIRTFTESTDVGTSETEVIRQSVANTKSLVFLGFAFHPLNLDLLYGKSRPTDNSCDCDIFATAIGISDSNQYLIMDDLAKMGDTPRVGFNFTKA